MARRIGSLIPSPNTIIEREFNEVLPRDFQLHVGRLRMGPIDEVGWKMQDADIDYQAELLGAAKVELIILAQTGASYFANDYDRQVKERIARVSGAPAMTGGEITGQAMSALGLRRVALLSPYSRTLNELGQHYYKDRFDVDVVAIETFATVQSSGDLAQFPSQAATAAMKAIDNDANEGFLIAGGNFSTLASIASWERQFGKPVITTNQAAIWAILRTFGGGKLQGYGWLLER